jgi:hypothetical protein
MGEQTFMGGSTALILPPYGRMNTEFQQTLQATPVPAHFTVKGSPGGPADYDAFIDSLVTEIAEVLWPRWDFTARRWVGKAAGHAMELTEADLDLIRGLRGQLDQEVKVGSRSLGKSQYGLFRLEDTSARGTIDLYLQPLQEAAPKLLESMKTSVGAGFDRLGATTLRLKEQFQRPRPYQVAFLLGRHFNYEYGASAVTPALVSGHCMQGLFARTFATMANRVALAEHLGARAAMQQYCREIGDRRVFAGVHYPTDNLSSWYASLRMCEYSFVGFAREAREFMWEAIQGSLVYRAMADAAKGPHPIYAPLLEWLEAEAKRTRPLSGGPALQRHNTGSLVPAK